MGSPALGPGVNLFTLLCSSPAPEQAPVLHCFRKQLGRWWGSEQWSSRVWSGCRFFACLLHVSCHGPAGGRDTRLMLWCWVVRGEPGAIQTGAGPLPPRLCPGPASLAPSPAQLWRGLCARAERQMGGMAVSGELGVSTRVPVGSCPGRQQSAACAPSCAARACPPAGLPAWGRVPRGPGLDLHKPLLQATRRSGALVRGARECAGRRQLQTCCLRKASRSFWGKSPTCPVLLTLTRQCRETSPGPLTPSSAPLGPGQSPCSPGGHPGGQAAACPG